MKLSFRTAARIAWRETRSSLTKFLFVVLAVAAGVGALAGVRGFSESFHTMLIREARTVMAADLAARQFAIPSEEQVALLNGLAASGVDYTWVTETVSMAAGTSEGALPVLASVKAVDPASYPYYGVVKLDPDIPLASALTANTVVVGEDLLIRLHLRVGDVVRLGGQDFRIVAAIVSEPDRMSATWNIGLRLMMSREGFARAGLLQFGSRATERYLFKLEPNAPPVGIVRRSIRKALPQAVVTDFRESSPIITNGLDQATTFLSLVSLIALIVGAIGVAMAMHAHLQQKMDHIAVMKSLGATSMEIIRIYMLQTLLLGVVGGLAGVAVGRGVEQVFPFLIRKYFAVTASMGWHFAAAGQGIAIGILTTLLFTLPPLLAIRKIRPAMILRRDMPDAKLPWRLRSGSALGAGSGWPDSDRHRWDLGVARGFTQGRRILRGRFVRESHRLERRGLGVAQTGSRVFEQLALAPAVAGEAGNGQPLPARQPGAGDSGGAGTRRDVHSHRVPGAGFRGLPGCQHRPARRPERVPGRGDPGSSAAAEGPDQRAEGRVEPARIFSESRRTHRHHQQRTGLGSFPVWNHGGLGSHAARFPARGRRLLVDPRGARFTR